MQRLCVSVVVILLAMALFLVLSTFNKFNTQTSFLSLFVIMLVGALYGSGTGFGAWSGAFSVLGIAVGFGVGYLAMSMIGTNSVIVQFSTLSSFSFFGGGLAIYSLFS